ncbi:hypothetical protein [Cryobacterium zhongshanensis]|uniref:Uncharacterized protein n=1 Tax=Cryobacterium zhongshanensis TaxID=2928153 RepID=A0AA41QZ57_9MICO|nr:hypothetical protein [Cryobacterium zhongshanensis]MCI4659759.1 hypothetical protein [Cryobacterium zhongshanensis]
MPEQTTPLAPPASAAARLAVQIADITARAKAEAQIEIGPAEVELAAARDDVVRAEARLVRAVASVRELQDLLGDVATCDVIMTQDEVDSHNVEIQYDERVDPMVFGHSLNSNP